MMGAAMLKCHRFVRPLWGWPKCVRGEAGEALVQYLIYSKNMTRPQVQDVLSQIIFTMTQRYSHISSYTRRSYLHPQFKM